MIIGYISTHKYQDIELSLRQANPTGKSFEFSIGDRLGFFFQAIPNKFNKLAYRDESSLVLCDGVPVRQSGATGYELIETLDRRDIDRGIDEFLNTIVSNVSMICLRIHENDAELSLSSDRASAGKMYYRYLEDGIAFSSDFTQLFRFGGFNLNDKGMYAIIRYGACPAPLTISRDIHAVPPAHYAVFDLYGNHIKTRTYFQFDFPETGDSDLDPVSSLLDSSTRILGNLGASIPISGGLDSTILAQRLSRHSDRQVRSYHLRFGDRDPELTYAREVAERTGCRLEIFNMESDVVPDTIIETARSYTHPFNDYSIIPTYYLMKCIAPYENEALIIDGTGGDECFGFLNKSQIRNLELAFALPGIIKWAVSSLYAHTNPFGTINKSTNAFWRMTECNRKDMNLVPLVLSPRLKLFSNNTREYDEEISDIFTSLRSRMLGPSSHNRSFHANVTVAKICQTSCGMWCAKTHNIKTTPNLQATYPFMWRDMLQEQGKLSLSAKVNNTTKKLPLKKLLEKEFSLDLVYRPKRGFAPPFETWFSNTKVYSLLCDTLLSQNTVIESIVDKAKLKKIVQNLPHSTNWPGMLHNFLWGAMFTELWINENTRYLNDKGL